MRVLLAEDDADLRDLMTYALGREGYTVFSAADGAQAVQRCDAEQPDIVLLDANLPKLNGFEVCRRLRHESEVPIIMLTARDEEEDILRGYQLGADDYVTKPFSAKQLNARIKAVLRRCRANRYEEPTREVRVGELTLDLQALQAYQAGHAVRLTPLEFRILFLLAMNEGRVIPYARLVEYAWGYDGGDSGLLKTHICHIRQKLAAVPGGSRVGIKAVISVGYSLARA
jgi:DNA-binding response OmpR family regulator